jgi:hypothetical protein
LPTNNKAKNNASKTEPKERFCMKNIRKFTRLAVIAAIGFATLSLTGCPNEDKIETVATPTADPGAGPYSHIQSVILTTATPGAEIYYTLNGTDPSKNNKDIKKYKKDDIITITPPQTIKAIAVKKGMYDSAILEAEYAIPPENIPTDDAILLTENIWADGELLASNSVQWFKFTATATMHYIHASFGTMKSWDGMYVQLYNSGGNKVANESNLCSSTKFTPRIVTPGQEYYIKVWCYSSNTGTYKILFNKSSTAPSVPVPLPNNAIQLAEGKWKDGNLTSTDTEQWFKFNVTTTGSQYIHVAFGTLSSSQGLYVQVYDSSGVAVESEARLYGSSFNISLSVEEGEYYINVRRYNSYNGTYQIAFNKSSTAPSLKVDLPTDGVTELTENIWTDGELVASSSEQWFKFTANASTQYIHAGFDGTLSPVYGVNVQVYDTSGVPVGSEARLYYVTSSNSISRTETSGQEFYIRVRPYNSYTGTYQIAFNKSSTAPVVMITLPSSATQLTENIWADGNFTASSGEQWFKFTATATSTQSIHVSFGTLNPNNGVNVHMFNSSGAAVDKEANLNGSGNNSTNARSVTNGQEYYIRVRPASSIGTYYILFNKSNVTMVKLPSEATQLTENTWAEGNFTSLNPEQWFKFTATATGLQYIHAGFDGTLSLGNGVNVLMYTSNGVMVGNQTNLHGSFFPYTSRSVTSGQEYYIKVWPYNSTGTYRIAVATTSVTPSP